MNMYNCLIHEYVLNNYLFRYHKIYIPYSKVIRNSVEFSEFTLASRNRISQLRHWKKYGTDIEADQYHKDALIYISNKVSKRR